MMKQISLFIFAVLLSVQQAWGLGFEFAGYVGNSGSPERPVLVGVDPSKPHFDFARFVTKRGNPFLDISLGPVYDEKTGLLYATAGHSTINVYSLDGRVVKRWTLPKKYPFVWWNSPRMARAGKYILVRNGDRRNKHLFKIAMDAPDGAVATDVASLKGVVGKLSNSARDGKVLITVAGGDVKTYDPATDATKTLCNIGKMNISAFEQAPNGDILLVEIPNKVRWVKFTGSKYKVVETPGKLGGSAFTIDGKYVWSCGGGTVNRYSFPSIAPDPGVVFGGASGSFIGVVKMNREMDSSYGIAKIKDGLFAFSSGSSQVIHIGQWDNTKKKLAMIRRIGAIPWINSLIVDSAGRIMVNKFVWDWRDDSLDVLKDNYNHYIHESVNLGNDLILHFSASYDYNKKMNVFSSTASTLKNCGKAKSTWSRELPFHLESVGSAAYMVGHQQYALLLNAAGEAINYKVAGDGGVQKDYHKKVSLGLGKGKPYSAMVSMPDNHIAVAVGGEVVQLAFSNNAWKEKARLKAKFSPDCKIAVDGTRVFVSEKDKNLVSVYSFKTQKLLGKLTIDTPTKLSVNGKRLVVYEEKNQRVSKYNLTK